eukprot:7137001-Pyramimonas_sp.AAC.1
MLSTLLNRWATDTRMRSLRPGRNLCLLGCSCPMSDRFEHYLQCPELRRWAGQRLRLPLPPATRLDDW